MKSLKLSDTIIVPAGDDSLEQKILHEADMLTHMAACEKKEDVNEEEFSTKLDKLFLTPAGNELAKQVLLEIN